MRQVAIMGILVGLGMVVGCASRTSAPPPPRIETTTAVPTSGRTATGPEATTPIPPFQFDYSAPPGVTDPQPSASAAPRPEPRPEPRPAAGGQVHIVERGDTLWKIAVRYYNDGQKWRRIADANGLSDPSKLRIGQRLNIP